MHDSKGPRMASAFLLVNSLPMELRKVSSSRPNLDDRVFQEWCLLELKKTKSDG